MASIAEQNQEHFELGTNVNSSTASTYDEKPYAEEFRTWLSSQVLSEKSWLGLQNLREEEGTTDQDTKTKDADSRQIKVLDYAAGTGNVSQALAPYVTRVLGVDISKGMVETYNKKMNNQGISPTEMYCVRGDLCAETPTLDLPNNTPDLNLTNQDFHNFNLAVVGLGFHHFENIERATTRLVERLAKDGVLLIIDFKTHEAVKYGGEATSTTASTAGEGHSHNHGHEHSPKNHHDHSHQHAHGPTSTGSHHGVAHHGFSEDKLKQVFTEAGLKNVEIKDMDVGFTWVTDLKSGEDTVVFGKLGSAEEQEGKQNVFRQLFFAKGIKV